MASRMRIVLGGVVVVFGTANAFFACVGDSTSVDGGLDASNDTTVVQDGGNDVVVPPNDSGCDAGQVVCGTTCTNTATDPANCGGCSKKCNTTDAGPLACINGKCGDTIVDVALGNHHVCVALLDGDVWCWGDNGRGQLGVPRSTGSSATPVKAQIDNVAHVSAGFDATCAVKNDNTVWCWGLNAGGALGHASGGGTPADDTNCTTYCNAMPQKVGGLLPSDQVMLIPSAGCARTTTGTVYCWGTSTCGDFGVPDAAAASNLIPSPVANVSSVVSVMNVGSSPNTECVIQDAGSLTCWGDNWFGQAGHTPEPYPPTCSFFGGIAAPSVVAGIGNVTSVSVSFNMYTCATDKAGKVYCWGSDVSGAITPPVADGGSVTTTPTEVVLGTTAKALKVVTGDANACALLDDGTIRCWGGNGSGEGGNGALGNNPIGPTAANVNTNGANVYAGSQMGGALLKDGSLVLWGFNQSGELGHTPGQGGDVSCGNGGHCNPSPTVVTGLP